MRPAAKTRKYFSPSEPGGIRPAADSRHGSGKAILTAKRRATRARDEVAAFKSAHRPG